MVSQSHGRAAACAVAAILAVDAGVKFYWALGGTWAGEAPLSASDQIREASIGLVGLMYAGILLVRAGFWHEHMPSAVARFADLNAWVVVIIPLGGAIGAFGQLEDPVGGVIDLIIAALAFVVVRSERPQSPTRGAAPTPRRTPGHPNSAR